MLRQASDRMMGEGAAQRKGGWREAFDESPLVRDREHNERNLQFHQSDGFEPDWGHLMATKKKGEQRFVIGGQGGATRDTTRRTGELESKSAQDC